jgi:Trypsin-like peptidase domain/Effector-associated domain 1
MSAPRNEPISADLIDRVTARVQSRLAATREAAPVTPTAYDSVHEAAAVLTWFDPGSLRASEGAADPADVEALLAHSQPMLQADGSRRWALSPRIRVAALRQLRERDRVRAALAANLDRPPGPLQEALETYLCGPGTPVERQSQAQLSASYQVCEWLRDAGFANLPDRDRILRRIDWLTLLQPFEHIAGEHFRGRGRELAKLRRYVDVLPSESPVEAFGRWAERGLHKKRPPLLVYGPGGVGKSALLARFILEHAQAHEEDRFPFVYLDFDRPDVVDSEPLTLLIEAVRQLGIEYPHARDRCEQIRRDWLDRLAHEAVVTDPRPTRSAPEPGGFRLGAVRDFGKLIESLDLYNQPVLFVLDTFEEVQWRSEVYVKAIWRLLDDMQQVIGRLRVCVSGRAQIPGRVTDAVELTGLDPEASIGYLSARGITDPEVARTLADQVKGNPLSLKLAAELYERQGLTSGRLDIDTRGYLFKRVADEVIQRQLYQRILGHIHNESVRRLAHPGLVLRFITPELIRHVLAGPCRLDTHSDTQARALFDKLQREVSLVVTVSDDILEHRPDLRRLMLELLETDDPRKVRAIRELAVTWYESRPPAPAERAEEIYHRLSLGQDPEVVDARWLPGVEPYLMTALPEFHGARLAYLASRLNLEVSEETRRLADVEDWERIVERKARDLLAEGRPEEALSLLRSRGERTAASPVFGVEATALAQVGRWADGFKVLDHGIEKALAATARRQVLDLTLQQAELVLAWTWAAPTEFAAPQRLVRRLEQLNDGSLAPLDRLTVLAHQLAVWRDIRHPDIAELEGELRKTFDDVSDKTLTDNPVSGRWAASVFQKTNDVRRLARVLRSCGWPRADEPVLRQAAASIAQLDMRLSTDRGEEPGTLAREFAIPARHSLTEAWSDFLLTASDAVACDVLRHLLEENADVAPAELVSAFALVMRSALGVWTHAPEAPTSTATSRRRGPRISKQARQDIATALAEEFPSAMALRQFLRQSLDRSFDSLVPTGSEPRSAALWIVEMAEQEGWLDVLLARAMEACPTSIRLARAAEQLGVSSLVSSDPSFAASTGPMRSAPGADSRAERLAAIEHQVCRVEIDNRLLGTGCLIGIDLVLTADHVLGSLWHDLVSSAGVTLRFGLTVGYRNQIVTEGTHFRLGEVVRRNAELDYALLRVDGSPGVQLIGGGTGPGGTLRRWIDVSDPPDIRKGSGLVMIGYTRERALALTVDRGAVVALRDHSAVYAIKSEPGSSGSPCFTEDLVLAALNTHRNDAPDAPRTASVGVLMSPVLDDLRAQGFGHLLGMPLA